MLSATTGRRILRDRPRITSTTTSMQTLRTLPANTVGRTYVAWLDREGVSPDTRDAVRYIDDEESAYVMQRYRECHDFYHAVTGLPVYVEGEVALKAFEFANTGSAHDGAGGRRGCDPEAGRARALPGHLPPLGGQERPARQGGHQRLLGGAARARRRRAAGRAGHRAAAGPAGDPQGGEGGAEAEDGGRSCCCDGKMIRPRRWRAGKKTVCVNM